jgi:hypothetical protein
MIDHTADLFIVIPVLALWIIFPLGMFLSFSHVDKNTDQIIHFKNLSHDSVDEVEPQEINVITKAPLLDNFKIATGTNPKWARH